jgi:polyphosphate kinase
MDRNFFRRIEICFPVLEPKLKKRVLTEGLNVYLKDNTQAWEMDGEGNYRLKTSRRGKKLCAQEALLTELAAAK